MEKIINFNSGFKIPSNSSRHTTLPPNYYSAQSAESEKEDDSEGLSPVYVKKKQDQINFQEDLKQSIKKETEEIKQSKNLFSLSMVKAFDTDESDSGSPEKDPTKSATKSISFSKGLKQPNQSKFKTMNIQNKNILKEEDIENNDNEIKPMIPLENIVKQNEKEREKKKFLTTITQKKDLPSIFKAQFQNKDEVNSEDEVSKLEEFHHKEQYINNHPYRHLIFGSCITESIFKRHITLTYRGLVYAKKCLKGPSEKFIKTKQVCLVDSKVPKTKTLFFDLDETLVHSCQLKEGPDHVIQVVAETGEKASIGINIRPYCFESLEKLNNIYEIFVFTASSANYANSIINFIDPQNKYINGILTRENCMETKIGFFIKDLRIIKNRELKNMIIVDNLAHSFGFQIENGVPILEFHNNKSDKELKYITNYLIEAAKFDDIREFNKKMLKLNELSELKIEEIAV